MLGAQGIKNEDLASNINYALMPIGYEGESQPLMERITPSNMLLNSVGALLNADPNDPVEDLAESSVMGFVFMYVFFPRGPCSLRRRRD